VNRKFSFESNHESNRRLLFEFESNHGVVVQCRLNEVIIIITDEQLDVHIVRILLVAQTILHDCSYSASECVCST